MAHLVPQNRGNDKRNLVARRKIAAGVMPCIMHERQKPIAEWMNGVLSRHKISAREWAERAHLGKDTVSRAMRDNFESVTSTSTIAKLADAVNERPFGAAAAIPNEASLAAILQIFLAAFSPDRQPGPDSLQAFAAALRETLLHLADEPASSNDLAVSQALARATVRRATQPTEQH